MTLPAEANKGTRNACAFVFVFTVLLERWLAAGLDATDLLTVDDVLLDSDPQSRLRAFAHNWLVGVSITHPGMGHIPSTIIRVVQEVLEVLGLAGRDAEEGRRQLGLWVAPLAGGVRAIYVLRTARLLGAPVATALLLTLVLGLSASHLLFGALPESYGPSGAILTIAGFFLARSVYADQPTPLWKWLLLASCATCVTVTNGLFVALLWLFSGNTQAILRRAFSRQAIALGLLPLLAAALVSVAGNTVYGHEGVASQELAHKSRPRSVDRLGRLASFPTAILDSFALPELEPSYEMTLEKPGTLRLRLERAPSHRLPPVRAWPFGVLMLVGLVAGLRSRARAIALGAAALIAVNVALHSFWGHDLVLYSQHWHAASVLLVLLGVVVGVRDVRWSRGLAAGLLVLAVGSAIADTRAVHAAVTQVPIEIDFLWPFEKR